MYHMYILTSLSNKKKICAMYDIYISYIHIIYILYIYTHLSHSLSPRPEIMALKIWKPLYVSTIFVETRGAVVVPNRFGKLLRV